MKSSDIPTPSMLFFTLFFKAIVLSKGKHYICWEKNERFTTVFSQQTQSQGNHPSQATLQNDLHPLRSGWMQHYGTSWGYFSPPRHSQILVALRQFDFNGIFTCKIKGSLRIHFWSLPLFESYVYFAYSILAHLIKMDTAALFASASL